MQDDQLSKVEKITYHRGALDTLVGEHNELSRMVAQVENLIRAHIQELEKLGVKMNFQQPGEKK
jgi:hypothetical protein